MLGLAAILFAGCATSQDELPTAQRRVRFWLEPSQTEIFGNEELTVTSHSTNTVGRDTDVEWHVSGGDIEPLQGGRIARVTFRDPGTYTIIGTLFVEGEELETESVHIRVKPLS
jgi:hypothetical protein